MPQNLLASRERRMARRATAPLGLMAATFLLPTYRMCADQDFESPASIVQDSWGSGLWIAPVFIIAAVMAILTVRALVRSEVDRRTRMLALVALSVLVLSSVAAGVVWTSTGDWPFPVSAALTAVLAGSVVRRARGMAPWQMWERLLLAFAIAAAGSGPSAFLIENLVSSRDSLGPGAYVYLGSLAGLLLVTARASRREGTAAP